jgi:hypothetical protein
MALEEITRLWALMEFTPNSWNVRTEQAGTEASRYSEVSGRKKHVVRTDDAGVSGVRTGWHIVRTADRELWNSSDFTLNSGIPICSILTYKWFCPITEWGQNTNKLPLWPFWDKNHLTGLEIHSRSKMKITSPFCHKGTKGKQSNKN